MFVAENVTKQYPNGVEALKGVSIAADPGEIYCLLGPNGAGKSTLINIWLDFIRPTSGQTFIGEVSVQQSPVLAKQHLAYLPDNVQLFPEMAASDNLQYFARLAGKRLDRGDVLALLEQVRLDSRWAGERVGNFSKGMRQKLGLAVILTRQASVLILDEPLTGLDPKSCRDLVDTLLELRRRDTSMLIATHDIFRTRMLADKVGIISSGRLVEELSGAELKEIDLEKTYLEHFR